MTEREKIWRELEYCIDEWHTSIVPRETLIAAVETLREDTPRVLTLAEAAEADVCWLEVEGVERMPPCRIAVEARHVMVRRIGGLQEMGQPDEYGTVFRCWSRRPTMEERKGRKWQSFPRP